MFDSISYVFKIVLYGLKHTVNVPDEAKIAIQSENTVVEEKKEKRVKEQQYPLDKYINFTSKNICDTLKLPPTCSDITQNEIDTEHLLRSVDETLESLQLDIETFVNRTVAKFSNLSTTKYSDDEKLHVNRLINKWMTENRINYENNRLDKTFVKSITSISDAPNSHKHYNSLNTVTDIVVNTKKQNIRNSKPNDTTKKLIKESPQSRKDQRHTLHLHEHTQQPSVVIPKLSPENLSNESSKPTNLLKRLIIQDMPSINIRNALKIQHTGSINLTPNENQRHQKSTNIGVFNITHSDSSSDVSQQVFMIDNGPANSRPRNLQNPAESNFSICSDTDSQGDIQVTITVPNTDIHYVEENEGNISTQITPILNSQENKVDNSYHSENLTERHEVINTIESCHNSEESQQTFETKSMIPAANANKKSEQTNVAKSAEINEAINHHHLNDKTVLDTLLSKNSIEEFQETSETKSVSNNEIKNNSIEKTNVIGMIEPLKAQQINNKEVVRTSPPVDTSKSPVNDGTLKNTNILGVFETNTLVLTEIIDLLNKIKQQKCCCLTNHNHEDYQMVDRSKSGEETITKSIKMKQYSNSDKILEKDFSSDSTLTRIEELIYINKDSDEGEESSEKILKLSGILKTNTSTQSPNLNTSSTAASNKTNLLLRKVSFTNLEELTTQNEPIQSPKSITQSVQTDSSIILETDKVNYEFNKKNEHKLTKDIKQNVDKETNTGTPLNMTGCSNLTQTTLNSIDQGKNIVININPVPLSYSNNDVVKRTFTENINKYKEFGVQTDKSSERKESEVGITQEQIEQPKFFELGSIKKPTSIPFNQKSLETQALNTSKVDEICQDMNASIQALLAETSVKTSPFKNISIEYQDFANQFILDTVNSVRIPISNATSNAIENQNIAHKNKNKVLGNKDKSYRNKNVDSSNSSSLYTTTSLSEGEIRQPCNCSCSLGEIHTCTIPTSLSTPKSNKKPKKSTVSPEMFQRDNPHLRIQKTRKHKNWHCIYTTSQSSSSIDESSDYSK